MTPVDEHMDRIYAIWWITHEQWEHLSKLPADFGKQKRWPDYIIDVFNFRCGRPPAGARILQSPGMISYRRYFSIDSIVGYQTFKSWPVTEDYEPYVAMGGMLVYVEDLWHLADMPGTFTTRSLKPIAIPPPPVKPEPIVVPPKAPPKPEPVIELPKPQYPLPEPVVEPTVSEEPDTQPERPKETEQMFERENQPSWGGEPKKGFIGFVQRNPIKVGFLAVVSIILLCMALSSMYTINETERGVVLAGGKLVKIEDPGIHFKVPGYHEVKRISLQTWTDNFAQLSAYSKDTQPATMRVSVTWTVQPSMVGEMYRTALTLDGVTDRFIRKITPNETENAFGQYEAATLAKDRNLFVQALTKRIREQVPAFVNIVSVQVENINFSDAYENTIEEKVKSLVAVDTAKNREQQAINDAAAYVAKEQGVADAKKNQMLAEAEGIRARGDAEASAIIAKANALKNNPQLIQLIEAENWNGSRATTIYGAVSPMVQVK